MSTLSFHATKAFHTIEGGAICTDSDELVHKLKQLRGFGIDDSGNIATVGVNAELNEFQAAMGLCVLDDWEEILKSRQKIWFEYYRQSSGKVRFQEWSESAASNYSYAPLLFS